MSEAPEFETVAAPASTKKKNTADVYTMLLIIALVSLLMGCGFLWAEIKAFGGFGTV
ncbi:MAG: hypothetical protein AAGA92_00910 [Planctomycetota bacterium]